MKKQIPSLVTICLGYYVQAQQLTNSGFEQWTTVGAYEDPTNWFTINSQAAGVVTKATQPADVHGGSFSVKLSTVTNGPVVYPGVLANTDILSGGAGVSFVGRPDTVVLWLKYNIVAPDTFSIAFNLKRNVGNDVGSASSDLLGTSQGVYQRIALPFDYVNLIDIPDTIKIILFLGRGSTFSGTIGSNVFIDDITLIYNPAVSVEEANSVGTKVYPYPTTGVLFVESNKSFEKASVLDLSGRVVFEENINVANQINLSSLATGLYTLHLSGKEGVVSKRIQLQK